MITYPIKDFKYGIINSLEEQSIPDGAFSDALNWLTQGDKVEIRKGFTVLGDEDTTSNKTYVHTGYKSTGEQVLFKKVGAKLYYYNDTDWVEIGDNLFTTAGVNDIPTFTNYASNAGNCVYISSPKSGLFKIMTANPGSYTSLYVSGTNYKGHIKIINNRMWLWARSEDKTGVYLSKIDTANYTTVNNEVIGTGDGTKKTFSSTLTFKAGSSYRTCFGIYVYSEGSLEVFRDNYDGTLTGSLGGTGTINYTTGAISVTFVDPPSNTKTIVCDYQWENSNDGGVTDFRYSTPRNAGEGLIIRQDAGGDPIQTVLSYNNEEYVFHKTKVWKVTFQDTDDTTYNKIWRENVGIPNIFCACSTGDGIYYIDTVNDTVPNFRKLTLDVVAQEVIPVTVTTFVDFAAYVFDYSSMIEFGDYILFTSRHYLTNRNQTVFAYNKIWKSIDRLDWALETFAIYNNMLIGGSSINGDALRLFHNFIDNLDYTFNNYVIGNSSELKMERLKKLKKIVVEGEMSPNQSLDVYLSPDKIDWIKVGTISGDGSYVDYTSGHDVIGDYLIGEKVIGSEEGLSTIYHYKYGLKVSIPKFNKIKYKFVATGIGYISVSLIEYWDIRRRTYKLPSKYRKI